MTVTVVTVKMVAELLSTQRKPICGLGFFCRVSLAKAFQKPTQAICEPLWAICGRGFNSDNKKAVVNLHKYRICSS